MRLVIDRKIWLRGDDASYLLRPSDGKMCCLGIYLEACGINKNAMNGVNVPSSLGFILPEEAARWMNEMGCVDATMAMNVNDNVGIDDVIREQRIAEIFARHDVEVEFVG